MVVVEYMLSIVQRLPYLGPIYGGLREGVSIYLQGTIPENINRFFINLLCGESESSDIALHFNPRFDGRDKVVFNTCQNGSWESEEKIHSMPFCKGQAFEMIILVSSHGYKIKVNGNDFHHFKHRIPFERVCAMQIAGDVSIQTINVIGPVPFSNMIPGGMFPKRTIIIRGMVPYGGDSRSRDIAFHLNPRVREGVVVRNSMIGGCWGQEEREISMNPFMEGQYFDMSIRCGNGRFKVFVNGQHLFDFVHRFQSCNEIDIVRGCCILHNQININTS
uniref:Galectin n=1 Tax=Anabas testudineus TaxID=64144 RepID=A0A3Q1J9W4_ANATE